MDVTVDETGARGRACRVDNNVVVTDRIGGERAHGSDASVLEQQSVTVRERSNPASGHNCPTIHDGNLHRDFSAKAWDGG